MNALRPSTLNIPIAIDLDDLELLINNQLKGIVYEDNDMNDNGGDRLMARVEKNGTIEVQLDGQLVQYFVPLKIWIKKGIGPASIEAQGAIGLHFKTRFEIEEDWTVLSSSEVGEFEWHEKPVIKLGLFNMPVELIASNILKKSSAKIAGRIDKKIQENFNLRLLVRKAWQHLKDPILLSREHSLWLSILPRSVKMTPLKGIGEKIHCTLSLTALLNISLGRQPDSIVLPAMPSCQWADEADEDFDLHLKILVSYEHASQLAQEYAKKQPFGPPGNTVQVEALNLIPQGEQLKVEVHTSGAIDTEVLLHARPVFHPDKNELRIETSDLELAKSNFVLRGLMRLLKGTVLRQLEERLRFPLTERLDMLKDQFSRRLESYELASEVFLDGQLEELSLRAIDLQEDAFRLLVDSTGTINISVDGFRAVEEKLNPETT